MVIGCAVIPATAGAQDSKPIVMDKVVVNETKTHTLFMGADIAVNLGKDLYPVRGVVGSSWVIDMNGKEEVVSTKQAALTLKITPSLKLTDVSAKIAGYKKERGYSFNNDPSVRLTRGLDQVAAMNADLTSMANNAQYLADAVNNKALGDMAALASSDNQFGAAALQAAAGAPRLNTSLAFTGNFTQAMAIQLAAQMASNAAITQQYYTGVTQQNAAAAFNQTENGNEPGGRLVQTGLDAMDVEFEISSARPLRNPYVVTMTRFHPKGTKPGTIQNLVYAKELHSIDKHPTNVQFVEGGFPYDFELIDFQLHLYNRGEEVATTVSSKRVELTRDEAFEYVKIEYVGAHKGETLPAVPAMGHLPAELLMGVEAGKYRETFYVKVSKDGLPDGKLFLDAACSKRVDDAYLESAVKNLRFKPALESGKPAEGVASLNLRQLKI